MLTTKHALKAHSAPLEGQVLFRCEEVFFILSKRVIIKLCSVMNFLEDVVLNGRALPDVASG